MMRRRQVLMRSALLGLVALAAIAASGTRALAADVPSGTWRGPWYLGMTSGTAELQIVGEPGARRGSLRMTNNENFGSGALPLASLEADENALRFKVVGDDGRPLVAEFPLTGGNFVSLKGFARYGGHKLRFELLQSPAP